MPLVTFFSVLERPEKTVRELQQPLLVRRGLRGLTTKVTEPLTISRFLHIYVETLTSKVLFWVSFPKYSEFTPP